MSDPRRLLELGTDAEVELLRSARDDGPSPHARRRALVALGLGGSIVTASATATTGTAAAAAASATASAAGVGVFKWVVFGVVSGLVTAAGSHVVLQAREAPAKPAVLVHGPSLVVERMRQTWAVSTATAPTRAVSTEAPSAPSDAPTASAPADAHETHAASTARAPAAASPPRVGPESTAAPSATTLAQEVASLDGAREALSSGDAAKALDALDAHNKRFKGGALAPEVDVLRMEALLQRGDRAGAAGAANAFLAAHPNSPHANRVRSILAQATSGGATPAAN